MQEIKCPKCGEVFTVDESGYAAIVKQVHDKEFNEEIKRREESFENEKRLAVTTAEAEKDKTIAELNAEIQRIINEKELALQAVNSEKKKIAEEKETAVKLAVTTVEADKDKLISELRGKIAAADAVKEKALAEKNNEITRLYAQIETDKIGRAHV